MIRLIIFLMLFPTVILAKNQTVYYDPQTVVLTGVLKTLQFPGAPNYSDIKNGDTAETGTYIILDKPIDVVVSPATNDSNDNSSEKNVSLLQLVVPEKQFWEQIKEGLHVRIKGTLFHALTGHHHARVLINLTQIQLLTQPKQNNPLHLTPEDKQFIEQQHVQLK